MSGSAGRIVLVLLSTATWAAAQPAEVSNFGPAIDLAGFRYRRSIPPGPPGLVALPLDPAVLAHSQGPAAKFADLRVVDDRGRQIPYVLERRVEPLSVDLHVRSTTPRVRQLREDTAGTRSIYALLLPYPNLPDSTVVLETSDHVFRRIVQIGVEREPDRRHRDPWFEVLASSRWQHTGQDTPAPPFEAAIAPGTATELLLIVEEGDNQPLAISAARLLLPSWRVRLFRPDGRLHLVYGKNDAAAPEYDLALLKSTIMRDQAREISAGPEEAAAAVPRAVLSPAMFWAGLSVAVLVLLALIVRLLKTT